MALPKIEVPTFEVEIPGIDKKIKCRPFLVKEDKILILGNESGELKDKVAACQQVVENCTFGEVDIKSLAMYQLQLLFIKIKSKSIGDILNFVLSCGGCDTKIDYDMNINDFKVMGSVDKNTETIKLNDETGVVLKYPNAEVQSSSSELSDLDLISKCIDHIYSGEEIVKPEEVSNEELVEWIENLPLTAIENINKFFENVPVIGHTVEFTCKKCEQPSKVTINGYEHFFV